jgi:hypothetical protein
MTVLNHQWIVVEHIVPRRRPPNNNAAIRFRSCDSYPQDSAFNAVLGDVERDAADLSKRPASNRWRDARADI